MSKIEHEIKIKGNLDAVYQALMTLQGIKSWHSAEAEGTPNLHEKLITKGHNKPTFVWKITELKPHQEIEWECEQGPGDATGTKAIFKLEKSDEKHTLVRFSHLGWPDTEGHFKHCNTLWAVLLYHLQQYVETSIAKPTFN